ncbi:Uncharacterised protein [Chlamydia abortus]|nr:Uncharacterised protein [Chlamydia abortus]
MSHLRPDVVTITFRCVRGVAIITGVCVIGSSRPCGRFLKKGRSAVRAIECLLDNGFHIKLKTSNTVVLKRKRHHCS